MKTLLTKLKSDLAKLANPKKKAVLQRFFKTGPGEYAEGDIFLGIMVPQSRSIALKYKILPFSSIRKLLSSTIHEERLVALLILVYNFQKGDILLREKVYKFYLSNTKFINNWDLVDLTAHKIVGQYVFDNPKVIAILPKLGLSKNLWERRIAVIATFQFIKNNKFEPTLKIAKLLLKDKHDLIHKAVGWMLREVGKREKITEINFLKKYHTFMPRMMFRYAVERLSKKEKAGILNKNI